MLVNKCSLKQNIVYNGCLNRRASKCRIMRPSKPMKNLPVITEAAKVDQITKSEASLLLDACKSIETHVQIIYLTRDHGIMISSVYDREFHKTKLCIIDTDLLLLLFYVHGEHLRPCWDGQLT